MIKEVIKIALYIMNIKCYFTFKSFIEKYGVDAVTFVVSSNDQAIKKFIIV